MSYKKRLERALAEAQDRLESERGRFSSDPLFASKRRQQNLFDPLALRSARVDADYAKNEGVVMMARYFLNTHAQLVGRICAHPNCLRPIQQATGRRGRPKKFCSRACQEALASWIQRREEQGSNWSALPWRDFDNQPTRVRGGRKGFRAALRRFNAWWGLDSVLTPELRRRLHEVYCASGADAVNALLADVFGKPSEWRKAGRAVVSDFP